MLQSFCLSTVALRSFIEYVQVMQKRDTDLLDYDVPEVRQGVFMNRTPMVVTETAADESLGVRQTSRRFRKSESVKKIVDIMRLGKRVGSDSSGESLG